MRFNLTVLISFILLFFSCDQVEFSPLDPENPDFIPPDTFITMGSLEGAELDTSTVTITWSGNELTVEYAYSFNGGDYSDWITSTSVTYDYLDEGDYTFSVKGRYITGDEDETPATVNFSVNMVPSPGIRVYTLLTEMNINATKNVDIYVEGVEDLVIVRLQVQYDANLLSLSPEDILKGALLTGIEEMIFFAEIISPGLMEINVGIPNHSGVAGTGSLLTLPFTATTTGSSSINILNPEFGQFGDISGDPESFTGTANGMVVVE